MFKVGLFSSFPRICVYSEVSRTPASSTDSRPLVLCTNKDLAWQQSEEETAGHVCSLQRLRVPLRLAPPTRGKHLCLWSWVPSGHRDSQTSWDRGQKAGDRPGQPVRKEPGRGPRRRPGGDSPSGGEAGRQVGTLSLHVPFTGGQYLPMSS